MNRGYPFSFWILLAWQLGIGWLALRDTLERLGIEVRPRITRRRTRRL